VPFYTFVLLGDSEVAEGSVWEALELASYYKLNNLVAILDCNRLGQADVTMLAHDYERYVERFAAFGWRTILVDGHDIEALMYAFDMARMPGEQPVMVIAKTFKGYGVARAEDKEGFHGRPFKKDELPIVLKELHERFAAAADYTGDYTFKPTIPSALPAQQICSAVALTKPTYEKGTKIATRKAYGQALVALGQACAQAVVLDAEVKNSTFTELFEKQYPQRFVECFIAEQNMVGVAVGLASRGKLACAATFGAFFARAFDQLRMAAIGRVPLRLAGSHAGVSIGEDGPSQMALEDIAIMRTLPNSVVVYPSDAVSAYALVEQTAQYNAGISYIRTTRADTEVIYSVDEQFPLGGCKIIHQSAQDRAVVVAAGITLHEARKAYATLQQEGIFISVVDLYSIKPLDQATLKAAAKKAGNTIIIVEDHYREGGIAQAVMAALCNDAITFVSLAVTELPRSGKPEELLAMMQIDASAIIRAVKEVR